MDDVVVDVYAVVGRRRVDHVYDDGGGDGDDDVVFLWLFLVLRRILLLGLLSVLFGWYGDYRFVIVVVVLIGRRIGMLRCNLLGLPVIFVFFVVS